MTRRRLALCALAATTLALACKRDEVIAVHYGPVRIEVRVHTQEEPYSCTKRIRAGQPRLVVHDDVPFELPAWCDRPEIVQNGGKKLFAVHCPATGQEKDKWRVIRRLGGGRWLEDCPREGRRPPDLEMIPPLEEAAPDIIRCSYRTQDSSFPGNELQASQYRKIAEELAKTAGPAGVARFLEQVVDEPLLHGPGEDGWVTEAWRLDPGPRDALLARVCPALARDDASDTSYVGLARVCPLDRPEVVDQALARSTGPRRHDGKVQTYDAWPWALAIAVRSKPADAGKALCDWLGRASGEDGVFMGLVALGASGVDCPAAARLASSLGCGDLPDGGCVDDGESFATWGSEIKRSPVRPPAIASPPCRAVLCAAWSAPDAGAPARR